jgi:mono/diheme cytochrome c family protein
MNPLRIFATIGGMIAFFWMVSFLITHWVVPDEVDPTIAAVDITRPRAPVEARGLKNPIPVSEADIKSGKALYLGKGNCYICHGKEGRGNGEGGAMLNPQPRDLTDPTFQALRTDGEIFWSIKEGVPQSGMFSYVPRMITEEEAWKVVRFIRTLQKNNPTPTQ